VLRVSRQTLASGSRGLAPRWHVPCPRLEFLCRPVPPLTQNGFLPAPGLASEGFLDLTQNLLLLGLLPAKGRRLVALRELRPHLADIENYSMALNIVSLYCANLIAAIGEISAEERPRHQCSTARLNDADADAEPCPGAAHAVAFT
jgi:hypothetical protein